MEGDKLISIIIVNWNGFKWLKKCLDSLYAQTYQNFEIVFVDNGSQDDSIVFVEKNYPKARIVASKENLGFAGEIIWELKILRDHAYYS